MKEGEAQTHELTGTINTIFDTQDNGDQGRRRIFIVDTEEERSQPVKFNVTNNRCAVLNGFNTGEKVKIIYFITGKLYYDKEQRMVVNNYFHVHYIEKID